MEIHKRIKRIVGDFNVDALHTFDGQHYFVKPNTFSKSGLLIDGKVLQPIGYGTVAVIPVSMTYGLKQEQIQQVFQNCIYDLKRIAKLLNQKSYLVAAEIGREVIEELCLCLNSVKQKTDKTLHDLVKRLNLKNRALYNKIVKVLSLIPKINPKQLLALCITPLYHYNGRFGKDFLSQNQLDLVADARKSCIPFLTDSTFEQDHFGIQKMTDNDLLMKKEEFTIRREHIDYSPLFVNGVETLGQRVGVEISKNPKDLHPVKKKKLFTKASQIMGYLENNDDPIMLETFGRLVNILDLEHDSIDYNRLIAMPHKIQVETPFVIPVIVEDREGEYVQVEYKPLEAFRIISEKMKPEDFLGSMNNDKQPFPFGGAVPLAKPRRIKSEVR